MTLFLFLILTSDIRELVYQAEVFGRVDTSLSALRALLSQASTQAERQATIRAIGIIKHPAGPKQIPLMGAGLLETLRHPQAMVRHKNFGFLLVEGTWLECGDWLEEHFIREIMETGLTLESLPGHPRPIAFAPFPEILEQDVPDDLLVRGASIRDILAFVSHQAGFNAFIDPDIDHTISGAFPIHDWLTLLDRLCIRYDIIWTRRGENVIFRLESSKLSHAGELIRGRGRKVENLVTFLQEIADSFDMELLLLSDELSNETIDHHYADQPWEEVLECLSMSNAFTWSLIKEQNERPKLVIHKN